MALLSQFMAFAAGLPEEVSISKAVLKRDYVVVAFSSLGRDLHQCWDVSYGSDIDNSADLTKVMTRIP